MRKTTETTRLLPVEMTADEKAVKSHQMAILYQEITAAEDRAKSEASRAKEAIKKLELDLDLLVTCVFTGKEDRVVDVVRRPNTTLRTWEIVRSDTSAVVESEAMSELEYRDLIQEKLPFTELKKLAKSATKSEAEKFAEGHGKPLSATVEELAAKNGSKPSKPPKKAKSTKGDDDKCSNCKAAGPLRKGRCRPCADFLRRHGTERHIAPPVVAQTEGTEAH
jgi:hypothetical protein